MTISTTDLKDLRTLPFFDETAYLDGLKLYSALSVENYCSHATQLLNGPTVRECIDATAGIRALSNSLAVYAVSHDGLISLSLSHLVMLCEGMLMPYLQPFVTLAEQQGHRGPLSRKGNYAELEQAKKEFGPAINFLATHGQPIFTPAGRYVGDRINEYERSRLSKLRNSIAHLHYRLEIVRKPIKASLALPNDLKLAPIIEALHEQFAKSLRIHNSNKGEIVDVLKSQVRWEGALGKPLTKTSAAMSFQETRTMVSKLESFVFSLAYAFVQAGCDFGTKVIFGQCTPCGEGSLVVPATESRATCPACGTTHILPSQQAVP